MESRDEAAPSHRTWKTPMKPAFPTLPQPPLLEKKIEEDESKTRRTDTGSRTSSRRAPPSRGALRPATLSEQCYFESGEGCSDDSDQGQDGLPPRSPLSVSRGAFPEGIGLPNPVEKKVRTHYGKVYQPQCRSLAARCSVSCPAHKRTHTSRRQRRCLSPQRVAVLLAGA